MTTKPKVNLGEGIDPSLYEYDASEPPDNDVYELMALRGVSPDVLVDPKDKAAYIKFLKAYKHDKG